MMEQITLLNPIQVGVLLSQQIQTTIHICEEKQLQLILVEQQLKLHTKLLVKLDNVVQLVLKCVCVTEMNHIQHLTEKECQDDYQETAHPMRSTI